MEVSCGGYFTIFLINNGNAYACGNNTSGQLGIGKIKNNCISIPTKVKLNYIKKVSTGYNHTLYIVGNLSYGNCYSCGENESGQLGLNSNLHQYTPKQIQFFGNIFIIDISAGRGFSLFLTKSGSVYACGRNFDGRLGVKTKKKIIKEPIRVPIDGVIKRVFSGGYHSYFLGIENKENVQAIWTCGSNEEGQLGIKNLKKAETPQIITYFQEKNLEIRDISCANTHTLFITTKNEVYGVGSNKFGQLIYDKTENVIEEPLKLEKIMKMGCTDVFTGDDLSFFIIKDGSVYIAGKYDLPTKSKIQNVKDKSVCITDKNQSLNFPKRNKTQKSFGNLKIKLKVKVIRGGKYHIVILTKSGKYYSCGNNKEGCLGLGNFSNLEKFREVKLMTKKILENIKKKPNKKKSLYDDNYKKYEAGLNWKKQIKMDNKLMRENYKYQQRIKDLENQLKNAKNNSLLKVVPSNFTNPIANHLHNKEMEDLKKKNNNLEKENHRLKMTIKNQMEKIKIFPTLLSDNKILLKTKSEYQKILNYKDNQIEEYGNKIKELKNYIGKISGINSNVKKSKECFTKEEYKELLKWKNDRRDVVESFIVLKNKFFEKKNKLEKLKEKMK
jgi:alpha-tubulin suppressor-like RCC1 family protein